MIARVSTYFCPWSARRPFVYIHRGNALRQYNLTAASGRRLARACRSSKGRFLVCNTGWLWTRTLSPGYSEGHLDSGVPLIE